MILDPRRFTILRDCAANPDTPHSLLEACAKEGTKTVIWNLTRNPNLTEDLIEVIYVRFVNDHEIVYRIASHKNTPLFILEQSAVNKYNMVRHGVAENPSAPVSILAKVYNFEQRLASPDLKVLLALYNNSNCPSWLKAILATKWPQDMISY
jgi:hypothetical protein